MDPALGIVLIALGLLAWGGQLLSWLAPQRAVKLTVMEAEETVEPVYWADIRGEALWDSFTLWPVVVAGFLLVLGNQAWAYFGLVGGAIYVYFAGRGIVTRLELRKRDFRVGDATNVRLGLVLLGVWGTAGMVAIIAAVNELAGL